ncbi:MAG: imelysin family protein [Candidatus Saccharibacteria bacterium]|nr:imelysin family protein [Pseudorhodobacter sp.]
MRYALLLTLLATPALADFPETVRDHILPGYAAFAAATQTLADSAVKDCSADAVRPAFQAAYDAWMGVEHLRFGPVEADGLGLSIAYWPDPKGSGARAQIALLKGDPAALEPQAFAQQSVAARGLTGLERLLYPKNPLSADPCALVRATATDLAATARQIDQGWTTGFAQTVLTAGEPGNTTYLTRAEARQVMFTQLVTALNFDLDQRLGRPLGDFAAPHPERAEAVASGRSLTNLHLSLLVLQAMVETLTPDAPLTRAAFDRAITLTAALNDPVLAGVADPQHRLKIEIVQQSVTALRDVVVSELGPELDVGIGFNAADGD